MHMRTKKWARPELAACPFYINHNGTEVIRGTWRERFAHPERPLHMEMGCGKGVSTARMIADNPEVNYIVSDMSPDVLGTARRNIEEACGGEPDNVMILRTDICFIHRVFGPEDAAERIYIHFCNPWTEHPKHAKRRLTHPRQLMQYREFLKPGERSGSRRTTTRCSRTPWCTSTCAVLRRFTGRTTCTGTDSGRTISPSMKRSTWNWACRSRPGFSG